MTRGKTTHRRVIDMKELISDWMTSALTDGGSQ